MPSASRRSEVSRRRLVQASASAALVAAAPVTVRADGGLGSLMRERATRVLEGLDERQADALRFAFDDRARRRWTFMLGSRRAAGLPLEAMTPAQKDTALDLLATALSERGLLEAERIMLQQDILRDEWGKGSPDRNRERFSLQIYGAPSATAPWGWRWEGHHLSLTFTVVDDVVVSTTPSAFSSEPNTVPSGPHAGMVVLEEEALGRRLYSDLAGPNRRQALIAERSFGNIRTTAGNEGRFEGERAGVPLGDLPQSQIDQVVRLIEVYGVDKLASPLADDEARRLRTGDLMAARFAWAGADLDGPSIYYRLHGDTFLIEFATLRNQPQHHHAVRHDLTRNFGDHALG